MLTRRQFVAMLPSVCLLAHAAVGERKTQVIFFGTTSFRGQGIYVATFDDSTGAISAPSLAASTVNPGYLAIAKRRNGKRYLYATSDVGGPIRGTQPSGDQIAVASSPAMISAYAIDGSKLTLINRQEAHGAGPVVLSLTANGKVVIVANLPSGNFSTFTTGPDGALSKIAGHVQLGDDDHGPLRDQAKAQVHGAYPSPGGHFLLANDFAGDKVRVYKLNPETGTVEPNEPPFWAGTPGSEPRHLAFHPNGRWIYCIGEAGNSIDVLRWNEKSGVLESQSRVPTLPAGHPPRVRTGTIMISADGKFVYGVNRGGVENFVVFEVLKSGDLKLVQEVSNPGHESRDIVLAPSGRWFLTANNSTDEVIVFPRDRSTGELQPQSSRTPLPGACFALFV